jgi:hypothetical protein
MAKTKIWSQARIKEFYRPELFNKSNTERLALINNDLKELNKPQNQKYSITSGLTRSQYQKELINWNKALNSLKKQYSNKI